MLRCLRKRAHTFFGPLVQELVLWMIRANPADEILPGLWLGNRFAALDENWLQAHQITAVFNCSKDIPFSQEKPRSLYRVPVDDDLSEQEIRNLGLWSWEIAYKINQERAKGARVLVHCAAGMQRSAASIAIYLISTYRCTTDEAIAFLKSKRSVAFYQNANFYKAIKTFEKELQDMIRNTNGYTAFPKIPLPTDAITAS
jgi:protein tyrosine phosphatase